MSMHSSSFGRGPTPVQGGPVELALGIGAIASAIAGVFSSLWAGAPMVLFCIFAGVLISRAEKNHRRGARREALALALVLASIFACLIAGLPVYVFHWVPFWLAGAIAIGLYLAGLALGVLALVRGLWRVLAILVAAAAVAALIILPAPNASIGPNDKAHEWKIKLTVRDETGAPLSGARTSCVALMRWNFPADAPRLDGGLDLSTDENGEAEYTFHQDVRLKIAACAADKEATWDEGGYKAKTALAAYPIPIGDMPVDIQLTEKTPATYRPEASRDEAPDQPARPSEEPQTETSSSGEEQQSAAPDQSTDQ